MKRILVVESEKAIADLLSSLLRVRYRLLFASDAEQAAALLRSGGSADLILADQHIPKGSGYGLLCLVRDELKMPNLPFVLWGEGVDTEVHIAAQGRGASVLFKGMSGWEKRLLGQIEKDIGR
ncbi:response regulator [Candidatus Parcubacteria bacterium]|nr:response regulator [Candidatus Parcubacteria bacterium]